MSYDYQMTQSAPLSALKRLLDDPSPVVRKAVLDGVKAAGTEGVLWLENLTTNKKLGVHAKSLLTQLRTSESATQSFLQYVSSGKIELEEACLLLERTINPQLSENEIASELDRFAERTRELIAEPIDCKNKCHLLCRVLFGEEGFRGAQQSFATPEASLLSKVIRSKRGIPLSLSLIFLLVAQRLGLPVEPVGLPGRFMVGVFKGKEPFYIDCYEGGTFRTRAEVQLLLRENHLPADEAFLLPTSVPETLARYCRNLVAQFEAQGDSERSRLFVRLHQALEKFNACE